MALLVDSVLLSMGNEDGDEEDDDHADEELCGADDGGAVLGVKLEEEAEEEEGDCAAWQTLGEFETPRAGRCSSRTR